MFRGRFEHTIDSKGRVSIPAKFRELLAEKYDDRLILTNFDRCLVAYPYEEWKVLEERVGSLSMVKKEVKAFQRFFISGASECPIDKLGRILIPPTLRDYAQLGKNVVFTGMLKKFEIWAKERWLEEIKRSEENFEGIARPWQSWEFRRRWKEANIVQSCCQKSSNIFGVNRAEFMLMEP